MADLKRTVRKLVEEFKEADGSTKSEEDVQSGFTLVLHKRLNAARADADKGRLERAIKVTDKNIDELVYELYGLTAEEIKIVEGTT